MPAQLVALNDGPSILLDKPILLLGRHPECDVQIDSRKVSRRHCCIAQVDDHLVVRDLDSTNGIRINGQRVVEGRLHPGDELTIGNHSYRVTWDGAAPPSGWKAAEPAGAPRGLDAADEMLEGCDEPVPLPDNDPRAATPVPPATGIQGAPRAAGGTDEESVVLPEDIQLLPHSSAFPDLARPQPNPGPPG